MGDMKVMNEVLNFIKQSGMRPACKPGFAHNLNLSYNLIDKARLSVDAGKKSLTYRYRFDNKPTVGFYTALMDELSTDACFAAGLPAAPGLSLQMQTEVVSPIDAREVDIISTVSKLGRTITNTRTDFVCTETRTLLAFSSHVKYMPTGSFIMDTIFTNSWAFNLYSYFTSSASPKTYPKGELEDIVGDCLTPHNLGSASFLVTNEHLNPFGGLHGGCHAMIMERVGHSYAESELKDTVTLVTQQIDYVSAINEGQSSKVNCEVLAKTEDSIWIRVTLSKPNGKLASDGKLRLTKSKVFDTSMQSKL